MEPSPGRHAAQFRFYEELNDFLPIPRRQRTFTHGFSGTPSVKDTVEALGVPHTEVDLILVDGRSVGFGYLLTGGERIAVYPVFESLDITPLVHLRPRPLRDPRFVLDVHLGKLTRFLRLLGFDSWWANDLDDSAIIESSLRQRRIILTRDRGILKHGRVTHGYWVRATQPRQQIREVVRRFDLGGSIRPFTRCLECNAGLTPVEKDAVRDRVPSRAWKEHDAFVRCTGCGKIFWAGSHYARMRRWVDELREEPDGDPHPEAHPVRPGVSQGR